jgi:hypothetical protein
MNDAVKDVKRQRITEEKDPFIRLSLAAKQNRCDEIREKNPIGVLVKGFEKSYQKKERN